MRTRIDFIADDRAPDVLEALGNDVVLVWKEWPVLADGHQAMPDAVDGTRSGTPEIKTQTVKALLHFVTATTQLRQFAEVQAGDCIMDLSPDILLKGREGLRFIIGASRTCPGEEWSSKPVSEQLAQCWDAMQGNRKIFQTVLLRRGT